MIKTAAEHIPYKKPEKKCSVGGSQIKPEWPSEEKQPKQWTNKKEQGD